MIQVQDDTAAIGGGKSRVKNLRMKPRVLEAIEHAAACVGMDSTAFITSTAYRAAQEVEGAQYNTVLQKKDFAAFAAAVEGPGRQNDALVELFATRKGLLSDG